MSTRLDLPPERDLPESRRRAIRAELVTATRTPRRRRRPWLVLAPLAALATVLAVVLGLTDLGRRAAGGRRAERFPYSRADGEH